MGVEYRVLEGVSGRCGADKMEVMDRAQLRCNESMAKVTEMQLVTLKMRSISGHGEERRSQ